MKLTDAESMKILINKSLTVPLSKDRISLFFKSLCKQKNEFVSFHIYTARRKTSLFLVVPTNTLSIISNTEMSRPIFTSKTTSCE